MIVEYEDRDRASTLSRAGPLRRPAARLILIACIVGFGAVLCTPALAVADTDGMHEHDDQAYEFSLIALAKPTGIVTLSLVGLTVCLGLLRRVRRLKPRRMLKLHKIIGFCALGSGLVHAAIILLTH